MTKGEQSAVSLQNLSEILSERNRALNPKNKNMFLKIERTITSSEDITAKKGAVPEVTAQNLHDQCLSTVRISSDRSS